MHRLARGWRAAESFVARVTEPRTDIATSDAEVARLARGSLLGRLFCRVDAALSAAWSHSALRRVLSPVTSQAHDRLSAANLRPVSVAVIVASFVALGIQFATPGTMGPLVWLVPALAVVVAGLVLTAADSIERALEGRAS